MNFAATILAPILMLFSASGANEEQASEDRPAGEGAVSAFPDTIDAQDAPAWTVGAIRSFQPMIAEQVHIEQRMTIRVAPRAAMPVPRDMFAALPQQSLGPRFTERKIGKCLPTAGIVGVEPNGSSNVILFMRDRRMINAELERSCRARSFYSGFYLSRSSDGMLCVDRDTLLSRSGTACKLSRIRQLIDLED